MLVSVCVVCICFNPEKEGVGIVLEGGVVVRLFEHNIIGGWLNNIPESSLPFSL